MIGSIATIIDDTSSSSPQLIMAIAWSTTLLWHSPLRRTCYRCHPLNICLVVKSCQKEQRMQEERRDRKRGGRERQTSTSGRTLPFRSAMSTPLVTPLLLVTTRRGLLSGEERRSMRSLLLFIHRLTYLKQNEQVRSMEHLMHRFNRNIKVDIMVYNKHCYIHIHTEMPSGVPVEQYPELICARYKEVEGKSFRFAQCVETLHSLVKFSPDNTPALVPGLIDTHRALLPPGAGLPDDDDEDDYCFENQA
jgi:hypothetical protein